jgi:photosynthetic reaction center H subunit
MNYSGDITSYIDVAQVVLYIFWGFFAALIYYLHRENKREGYPLDSDRSERSGGRVVVQGYPPIPEAKTYLLTHGGTQVAPRQEKDLRPLKATPAAPWPGAPLVPTGDPMLDGVGPAAYAERIDTPDLTLEGTNRIVPLRMATDHWVAAEDANPVGMSVVGADGVSAGTVTDVWVDRSETVARYLEVQVKEGGRRVLLPMNFARVNGRARRIDVQSILAKHFSTVPGTREADAVTRREEDRICAYYGGGTLYAEPSRQEPWL